MLKKFFTPKKLILVFAISIFATSITAHNVFGSFLPVGPGTGASSTGFGGYQEALEEEGINLQQFSLFNLDFTAFGLTKLLLGIPRSESGAGGTAPSSLAQNSLQNYGAFGAISSFLAVMYSEKPVSGVEYFANLGRNVGFIKPAHAQQQGFDVLGPITQLWNISRNLAYLAFVLIFVAIGFMIMMRARIDPRTVATVQAAIPGIVIALILVTLSFALAGLVIDMTQVATQLIANALGPVMNINIGAIRNTNIFGLMFGLMEPGGDAASNVILQIIASIPGAIANFLEAVAKSGLGESIIGLIFGILIVFTAFRVFIMLLTALVTIVLMTIGAPFMFLAAAIPGRGGAIVGWFRSIVSAALTFPLTFLLLAIAAVFLGFTGEPWKVTQGVGDFNIDLIPFGKFQPMDEEGEPTGPVLPIAQIIGIGILLLTPRVSDMLREAFQQRVPEWAGEPARAIGGIVKRFVPFA